MSDTGNNAVDFVRYVIESLVENPGDVVIDMIVDDLGILISLRLNKEDMGRIIGKNGQTIKSIRTLLKVLSKQANQRINLKIVEPSE